MKKIVLIMCLSFISIIACKSAPVATGPEDSSGFNTKQANNQTAKKGLNLPDGASVRSTPRGDVLVLHDPKSKTDVGKPANNYEVKFAFDKTIEIGSYKEAYNLVYQIINDNPDIRDILNGNGKISRKFTELIEKVIELQNKKKFPIEQYRSHVQLAVNKPESRKAMPDLLYAVYMYLTGEDGAHDIVITGIEDE